MAHHFDEHPHDVVMLTKRFASDDFLVQEPELAFPWRFLALMKPFPKQPRPLRDIKPKKKHYLALCELLLQQTPTESTRRSVEFLVAWH